MDNDLRLALFVNNSSDIITLNKFLALSAADRAELRVSLDWACVSLMVEGTEYWGPQLSFGPLGPLVEQLKPAAARLRNAHCAVICAPIIYGPVYEYILLDPDGNDIIANLGAYDTKEDWDTVPTAVGSEILYAFIDSNITTILKQGKILRGLEPVRVKRKAIIEALERESSLGEEVLELLGRT